MHPTTQRRRFAPFAAVLTLGLAGLLTSACSVQASEENASSDSAVVTRTSASKRSTVVVIDRATNHVRVAKVTKLPTVELSTTASARQANERAVSSVDWENVTTERLAEGDPELDDALAMLPAEDVEVAGPGAATVGLAACVTGISLGAAAVAVMTRELKNFGSAWTQGMAMCSTATMLMLLVPEP
jgi:hypothetical protein